MGNFQALVQAICSCVVYVYKLNFEYRMFIWVQPRDTGYVNYVSKKAKRLFRQLLLSHGYSERVAEELWKWYDFSEKKGVASY
jgi:two-component SAPR family response regulator